MPELDRDTIIDRRYRVVSRLGTGGMADVFLCEDQQLGRQVALKLLHRRFAEDPAFVERFRREAQAAAGLQHPNIVSVYDRGEYDGTYYITMEYLPGRTLKQLIVEEAPLDPVRAIDVAVGILKAARFAHRRGIVHRDLKPHNVIVDDAGTAKVTDFGIARAGASDMTETGSIMGTAQYLSPEQAQGRSVTASSDLYSVGVVLYEMLTGRVPFDAEQAVTIALKHVSEAPPPPHEFTPSIPPELEQTILWTLNKSPADRPVDADQLITVLEHCRQAIVAGAAGQNTASMAAVAAGAAAGLPIENLPEVPAYPQPSTNGTSSGQMAAVASGPGPPPRGRGWRPWLWGLAVLLLVGGAVTAAVLLTRTKHRTVPTVTGQQLVVARTILQNKGFVVGPTAHVTSAKPADTVIAESPTAGSRADKGSTVTLTVSAGPGNVAIPSVQGEGQAMAIKALRRAGLEVTRVIKQSSSRFPAGQATGTNPAAAASVPRGYGVALFVSTGVARSVVPPVIGRTQAEAEAALHNAGFQVSAQPQMTSSAAPGVVFQESPTPNSTATAGSTVTITVATAPATLSVPSVVQDRTAGAVSALQGLTVARRYRTVTDPALVGVVLAQSPTAGVQVPKGSIVTITIGRASGSGTATGSGSGSGSASASSSSSSSSSASSSSSSTTPTNSGTPSPQ